jgi:hypothetical protein
MRFSTNVCLCGCAAVVVIHDWTNPQKALVCGSVRFTLTDEVTYADFYYTLSKSPNVLYDLVDGSGYTIRDGDTRLARLSGLTFVFNDQYFQLDFLNGQPALRSSLYLYTHATLPFLSRLSQFRRKLERLNVHTYAHACT